MFSFLGEVFFLEGTVIVLRLKLSTIEETYAKGVRYLSIVEV